MRNILGYRYILILVDGEINIVIDSMGVSTNSGICRPLHWKYTLSQKPLKEDQAFMQNGTVMPVANSLTPSKSYETSQSSQIHVDLSQYLTDADINTSVLLLQGKHSRLTTSIIILISE